MTSPRIAVFAYSGTGHACLDVLLKRGLRPALVATHRDLPSEARWFPSVAELAKTHGIEPVFIDDPLDPAAIARIRIAAPDLIFSFYYRSLLPAEVLSVARLGAFNMHGSLLPKFRGRAPVNWAILKGETRTGATLHAMTERADRGAIVDQEAVPIGPDDTAVEVQARVTVAAAAVLERRLDELLAGRAVLTPQDEAQASIFGRRRPEDGKIDWDRPVQEVHDLVRAVTHPYPGAFTDLFDGEGGKTFIWRTRIPGLAAHDTFPGQVLGGNGRLRVACGDDRYLEILSLQPDGGAEVDAARFLESRG